MNKLLNFITIDFETASKIHDSVCSMGLVIVRDGKIAHSEGILINPECPIYYQNTDIHGITDEDVKDCPNFGKIWLRISHYFTEIPFVVAHNAQFDKTVFEKIARNYNIKLPKLTYYCTHRISKAAYPQLPSYSLPDLCRKHNIELSQHHDCLADSIAATELMFALQRNHAEIFEYKSSFKPKHSSFEHNNYDAEEIALLENLKYDFPSIAFIGNRFAVTGNLKRYTRKEIEQEIIKRGGMIGNISDSTDYLVVGDHHFQVSEKMRRALDLKETGSPIKIIEYTYFMDQMESVPYLDALSLSDELELQKYLQFIPSTSPKPKQLYYYPSSTSEFPVHCKLLGIELEFPLVVRIEANGEIIKIACDYLKEMQPTTDKAIEFESLLGSTYFSLNGKERNVLKILNILIDEKFLKSSTIKYADKHDKNGNVRQATNSEYKSIVISAKPTPYRLNSNAEPLLCRVKVGTQKSQYISFAPQHKKILDKYNISYTTTASDLFLRIGLSDFFSFASQSDFKYAINEIFAAAFNFDSFGCCSKYKECSEAGRCLHDDLIYASAACQYKKHLDNGEVFYK